MAAPLTSPRLVLRGWQLDDAPAALAIYGHPDDIGCEVVSSHRGIPSNR